VADYHTYFVGNAGVWIHNACRLDFNGNKGDFTTKQKNVFKSENAAKNDGQMKCEDCGKSLENVSSKGGTPSNQAQVHHVLL